MGPLGCVSGKGHSRRGFGHVPVVTTVLLEGPSALALGMADDMAGTRERERARYHLTEGADFVEQDYSPSLVQRSLRPFPSLENIDPSKEGLEDAAIL